MELGTIGKEIANVFLVSGEIFPMEKRNIVSFIEES